MATESKLNRLSDLLKTELLKITGPTEFNTGPYVLGTNLFNDVPTAQAIAQGAESQLFFHWDLAVVREGPQREPAIHHRRATFHVWAASSKAATALRTCSNAIADVFRVVYAAEKAFHGTHNVKLFPGQELLNTELKKAGIYVAGLEVLMDYRHDHTDP